MTIPFRREKIPPARRFIEERGVDLTTFVKPQARNLDPSKQRMKIKKMLTTKSKLEAMLI